MRWITKKLGDLARIELGKTPSRSNKKYWDEAKTSNNIWLSIADLPLTIKPLMVDSKEYISDEGAKLCKIIPKDTLIVSFKLSLGRLAVTGRDLYTNEAIAALYIHENVGIRQDYLYWYLTFFDWDAAAGSDIKVKGKTLNKAKLKEIEIILPSIPEQKRIVAILDQAFAEINKARGKTEQNLKNACELFESYLQQVFSQRGEGWVEHMLGDICTFKHGFAFKSEYFTESSDLLLLTPGNFFEEGGYRDRGEKQKYYAGPFPKEFLLKKGGLLVAMTEQAAGLLGSPALVPADDVFLHNQRLGLVELTSDFEGGVSMDFLFHLFNTKYFRSKVQETASGVKVRHTSPKKMQSISVWLPANLNEQEYTARKLFELKDKSIKLEKIYKRKILQLDDLKKSILQKAFFGELTNTNNKGAAA
jgi:type I restriction enzyme, S subunit